MDLRWDGRNGIQKLYALHCILFISTHNDGPYDECNACKCDSGVLVAVDTFRTVCIPSTLPHRRSYFSWHANRKSPIECVAAAPIQDHRKPPSNGPWSTGKWLYWIVPHSPVPRDLKKEKKRKKQQQNWTRFWNAIASYAASATYFAWSAIQSTWWQHSRRKISISMLSARRWFHTGLWWSSLFLATNPQRHPLFYIETRPNEQHTVDSIVVSRLRFGNFVKVHHVYVRMVNINYSIDLFMTQTAPCTVFTVLYHVKMPKLIRLEVLARDAKMQSNN